MCSRSRRNIQRVDYKILNSVGYGGFSMSDTGESSTQSESGVSGATGGAPDIELHQEDELDDVLDAGLLR